MKKNFYIHGTDELIDLYQESQILEKDWMMRFNLAHVEAATYHEIYNREDYIQNDCRIEPGDVVVDCGGNIGIFTSFAFDMGASRVLSFEPFIDNYKLNKKNNPSAEVFNLAVSNKSNELIELFSADDNCGGHTIMKSLFEKNPINYQSNNFHVKTITLDDIISQNFIDHIDFLKIDTEGAELMILEGLSDENLNKIRCISMEYHNAVFNYDENIYDNLQKRFNKLGFNTYTWLLDNQTRMLYVSRGNIFIDNPKHTN